MLFQNKICSSSLSLYNIFYYMYICMYLHLCLNLSIWSIEGANLNNQMWTL